MLCEISHFCFCSRNSDCVKKCEVAEVKLQEHRLLHCRLRSRGLECSYWCFVHKYQCSDTWRSSLTHTQCFCSLQVWIHVNSIFFLFDGLQQGESFPVLKYLFPHFSVWLIDWGVFPSNKSSTSWTTCPVKLRLPQWQKLCFSSTTSTGCLIKDMSLTLLLAWRYSLNINIYTICTNILI